MSLLLAIAAASASASGICVSSIHDGDTIRLCSGERVRLAGIDAPEIDGSARCEKAQRKKLAASKNPPWCDFQLGNESRDALKNLIGQGHVTIERLGKDAYGRTLAHIYVNERDAGKYLITWGLARQWVK